MPAEPASLPIVQDESATNAKEETVAPTDDEPAPEVVEPSSENESTKVWAII